MKRKSKHILVAILLSLSCSLATTFAYFTSSSSIPSKFKTEKYKIVLSGSGGTFSGSDVVILDNKTTLPTPNKRGYTFVGYSKSSNGNVDYSIDINNIKEINNKEIYAVWKINTYSISYNLNGGTISGQKTTYNVEESFTLPTPTKTGNTFTGWTGSNGSTKQLSVTIPKGTTNNLSYTANWSTNSYRVDVNPVIDGTTYNSGLDGYTFDVWVNGTLVADNVIDWCQNVSYGSSVRVKTNSLTGRSTSFDKTITVGTSDTTISPSWTINTYQGHFYYNNNIIAVTDNKYGATISTPNISIDSLGLSSNFYYISGYTPWTTWTQPDYAVGFTIEVGEYNCYASFGSTGGSNSSYQLSKLQSAGYNFCYLTDWGSVECSGSYSKVMGLYNTVWNILPRSGNGFSIYKQISCDSGWSTYERR